jgi:hypothetical protein
MNETLSPESPGGFVHALETLRHALADPLSAAGLKLELVERRLAAVSPGGPALAERLRGAKADLGAAGRLIDLLPHLGNIAGEEPSETSIDDLCRVAGIPLDDDAAPRPRLLLRRLATLDALRALVRCLRPRDPGGALPRVSAESRAGRLSLRIEAPGSFDANPERLFHLPRGEDRAEGLFLARASVESDGGRLELAQRDGLLVALVSWPLPASPGHAGTPA